MAAIMAVDVAADGHADILNALLSSIGIGAAQSAASTAAAAAATTAGAGTVAAGTTAAGGGAAGAVGMTVGGAVAAAVAIGYLAHCALQEVKRYDGRYGIWPKACCKIYATTIRSTSWPAMTS
jgi:hypothetical protein